MSIKSVDNVSYAGGQMWRWVLAMEMYAKAFKDIEPKRKRVAELTDKLQKAKDEVHLLKENLDVLVHRIQELSTKLKLAQKEMEDYKEETKVLQEKQERAEKLIGGLEGTKEGWAHRKAGLVTKYEYLVGDVLMSAAFMSYAGPFPSEYRKTFVRESLLGQVQKLKINHSKDYNFADFLVKPIDFLNWNFKGLPDDQFSKENAVLVTKSSRYPLMIDP